MDGSIWFLLAALGTVIVIAILCARASGEVDSDKEDLDWSGRW